MRHTSSPCLLRIASMRSATSSTCSSCTSAATLSMTTLVVAPSMVTATGPGPFGTCAERTWVCQTDLTCCSMQEMRVIAFQEGLDKKWEARLNNPVTPDLPFGGRVLVKAHDLDSDRNTVKFQRCQASHA